MNDSCLLFVVFSVPQCFFITPTPVSVIFGGVSGPSTSLPLPGTYLYIIYRDVCFWILEM